MAKSTRLTNDMRNRICEAVIKHRFGKAGEDLKEAGLKLGDAVYEALYPKGSRERERLAGGFIGEYIKCTSRACYFAGCYHEVRFRECLPFCYHYGYDERPKFSADAPVTKALTELNAAKDKLRAEKDEARAMVNGILSKPGTIGKLLEIWPEVEPFIPPETTPVHLPAVPRDEVNALLGLPSKDKE